MRQGEAITRMMWTPTEDGRSRAGIGPYLRGAALAVLVIGLTLLVLDRVVLRVLVTAISVLGLVLLLMGILGSLVAIAAPSAWWHRPVFGAGLLALGLVMVAGGGLSEEVLIAALYLAYFVVIFGGSAVLAGKLRGLSERARRSRSRWDRRYPGRRAAGRAPVVELDRSDLRAVRADRISGAREALGACEALFVGRDLRGKERRALERVLPRSLISVMWASILS